MVTVFPVPVFILGQWLQILIPARARQLAFLEGGQEYYISYSMFPLNDYLAISYPATGEL